MLKRRLRAVLLGGLLVLATALPALADQPPGLTGYEGQPGNQGGCPGQGNPGCSGPGKS